MACTKTGQTYTCASTSYADVSACFTLEAAFPLNGDIIVIPAGSSSWGSGQDLNVNLTTSITIQGSTTISTNCANPPTFNNPCTATDNTVITYDDPSGNQLWNINIAGSGAIVVRITGITFAQNSGVEQFHGIIGVGGSNTSAQLRVDHCHFLDFEKAAARITQPYSYGVWDHNVFDCNDPDGNGVQMFGNDSGFTPWSQPTAFGTSGFTFFENNTFNSVFFNDCNSGGRYVFRYNVAPTTSQVQSVPQSHATGSVGYPVTRGCRAYEVYNNNFSSSFSGGSFSGMFQTSGTMLSFGNVSTGYNHMINLVSDRDAAGPNCTPPGTATYCQNDTPNGWGYCASSPVGGVLGPSPWDGNFNLNGSAGWPCIDQPGRGQSNFVATASPSTYQYAMAPPWVANISCTSQTLGFGAITDSSNHIQVCTSPGTTGGTIPTFNHSGGTTNDGSAVWTDRGLGMADTTTGTIQWPDQKLEPVYSWNDFCNAPFNESFLSIQSQSNNIVQNRDVYIQAGATAQISATSPFNGTSGTGWGTATFRPTTCTAGPGGSGGVSPTGSYGVAYFATDANSGNGELYICTSTNTWTAVYQPYTYPHPLVTGTGSATAPSCTPTSGVVPQTVTCTNPNSGTTIMCYAASPTTPATNGVGTACTSGTQYSTAIAVSSAETLNVVAGVAGELDSSISSYTYTSSCANPVAVGRYTFCNSGYVDVNTGTSATVSMSPFAGNGILIFAHYCANASCNAAPTQTATIGNNINNPEPNCVLSPHSPYNFANTNVPDYERIYAWYCPSIPAGVTSFTVTTSATVNYLQLIPHEILAGQIASTGFFEYVDNTQNSGAVANTLATISTSGSTVNASDLITAMVVNCGASIPATVGTGYTGLIVNPSATPGLITEAKAVSSTGVQSATTSWSSGSASTACALGAGGSNDTWWGVIVPLASSPVTGITTLSPTTFNFGNQPVGTSSSSQTFTLTNNSATTVTGISISNVGGNITDFVPQSTTCGSSLASGLSCNIVMVFSPITTGLRSTTLTVTDSDSSSPQTAALSGTGTVSTYAFNNASSFILNMPNNWRITRY